MVAHYVVYVWYSDLSEPSGSDAADELMEDIDDDSDVELVGESQPTHTGTCNKLYSVVAAGGWHRVSCRYAHVDTANTIVQSSQRWLVAD